RPAARAQRALAPAAASAWAGAAPAAGGAGRSSLARRPVPGRPASCPRSESAPRRSARSSPAALALARALGPEHLLQERRDVSLDLDHQARLRQLRLAALQTPLQLGQLALPPVERLAPTRTTQRLQRTRVPQPPPLRQMLAVQALPPQKR